MIPVIGSGFGCVSYVLGPWTDYFPKQVGQLDSQYGVCIGTEIDGGDLGAVITAITVEQPFNIAGNNGPIPWRLIVIKGKLPDDGRGHKTLPIDLQLAANGWPRLGESSQNLRIIWSKIFATLTTPNNPSNSTPVHFLFPDKSGPSCGPSETLTVLYFPLFNDTGVPGYGANNKTYTGFTVEGLHTSVDAQPGQRGRAIAKGQLGS